MRTSLLFPFLLFCTLSATYAQISCPSPPGQAGAFACSVCNFTTINASTAGQNPSNPGGDWCGGVIDNDQYFGFVAGSLGAVEFEVTVNSCASGSGIQLAIFDADGVVVGTCVSTSVNPGSTQTLTATGLVPGDYYLLGIDGFAGAICDFEITPISGLLDTPPDAAGPILGPRSVCWETTTTFSINPVDNATGYFWTVTSGPFTFGFQAFPRAAFNPITGSSDTILTIELPEVPFFMPANTCDTIHLEVFPLNTCSPPNLANGSRADLVVCRNAIDTVRRSVCLGDSLEYPAGSGTFFGPSDYFNFNRVSLGVGPPDSCEQFEVLILNPVSGTDTLAVIRDTAFCSLSSAVGFTEPVIGDGLYYFGLAGGSGCGSLQPYNVIDVSQVLQQFPSDFCGTSSVSSLFDLVPAPLQGTLIAPGGMPVDTTAIPLSGLASGSYEFEVSGPGCVAVAPINIIGGLSFQLDTINSVFTGSVVGTSDTTFWFVDGDLQSTLDSFTVTAGPGDTLAVEVRSWNTCESITTTLVVFGPQVSNVNESTLVSSLDVWPNPTSGLLSWAGRFEAGVTPLSLSVYDEAGRLMETTFLPPVQQQQESLLLTGYATGRYRLVWTTNAGAITRTVDLR